LIQIIQFKRLHRHDLKHPYVILFRSQENNSSFNTQLKLKKMTYLLSRLTAESASEESTQILCYYVNNTNSSQIIRAISEEKYHFERVVFSREHLLFEALPESSLEVYSPLTNGIQSSKTDCKLLQVNQKSELSKLFSQGSEVEFLKTDLRAAL
jgi:Domain of unknown function (DUF1830)